MKMVLLINRTCYYSKDHRGTLECQFQGKMTKHAIYLKLGMWNSKMQPIPTYRPFSPIPPPQLPYKAYSQAIKRFDTVLKDVLMRPSHSLATLKCLARNLDIIGFKSLKRWM